MSRLIPVLIAVVAIAALTIVEGSISDRWVDTNRMAEYCADLLDNVPTTIGDWEGTDGEQDDEILKVAGAQGYVSRTYRNQKTGQYVGVWLIVGHARDTAEHTPDVCYPSQGFQQSADEVTHQVDLGGGQTASFWTALFVREAMGLQPGTAERVFWTWFKPDLKGELGVEQVEWVSPQNARFHFGSTKALYKLYFTEPGVSDDARAEESVCLEFAKLFLGEVNPILQKANEGVPEDYTPQPASEESA